MEGSRHRAIFKYHPLWGYQFRPNIYVRVAHYEPNNQADRSSYVITTNSLGGRTGCEPGQGPENAVRVLFLGCSFTAGDGVSNQRRFSDLLEQSLPGVQSHNYALSGSGNDQQYLIHRDIAGLVRPRVLIVSPYVGCLGRNLAPGKETQDPLTGNKVFRPKPFFSHENGSLKLQNSPVPKVSSIGERPGADPGEKPGAAKASFGKRVMGRVRRMVKPQAPDLGLLAQYQDRRSPGYRLTKAILAKTLEESRAEHKILMPLPHHVYFENGLEPDYLRLFREAAEQGSALLWDVLPDLKQKAGGRAGKLSLTHYHYSNLGHQAVAGFLTRELGRLLA